MCRTVKEEKMIKKCSQLLKKTNVYMNLFISSITSCLCISSFFFMSSVDERILSCKDLISDSFREDSSCGILKQANCIGFTENIWCQCDKNVTAYILVAAQCFKSAVFIDEWSAVFFPLRGEMNHPLDTGLNYVLE